MREKMQPAFCHGTAVNLPQRLGVERELRPIGGDFFGQFACGKMVSLEIQQPDFTGRMRPDPSRLGTMTIRGTNFSKIRPAQPGQVQRRKTHGKRKFAREILID